MSASLLVYGGFWLAVGALLAYYSLWGALFVILYLYGFIKGIIKGLSQ